MFIVLLLAEKLVTRDRADAERKVGAADNDLLQLDLRTRLRDERAAISRAAHEL
jgi:hypothetical protein